MAEQYYVIVILIATMLVGVILAFFTNPSAPLVIAIAGLFGIGMALAAALRDRRTATKRAGNVIFSLLLTAFAIYLAYSRISGLNTLTEQTRWLLYLATFVATFTLLNTLGLLLRLWTRKQNATSNSLLPAKKTGVNSKR